MHCGHSQFSISDFGSNVWMEGRESVLEAIFDQQTLEEDAEMLDAETLDEEFCEPVRADQSTKENHDDDDDKTRKQESRSRNWRRKKARKNKKKNNKGGAASNITDINRFVLDTCRHLKEKKSYLVWNAVGVLGASAISDLVKEVDAIQDCGGQMTADAKRYRTSGGILWNILKTREPKAYKEIMARGREFEKQFKRQNISQILKDNKETAVEKTADTSDGVSGKVPESSQLSSGGQESAQVDSHEGRVSVLSRIRAPVTYDDLFEENEDDGRT